MIPRVARSLNALHPAAAFMYFMAAMAFIFTFSHPLFIGTLLPLGLLQAGYFAGFSVTANRLRPAALFCAVPVIVIPLVNHRGRHVLFYLLDRQITLEAVSYGFYTACLLMSMFALFIGMNAVISSGKLLYLFSGTAPRTAFIVNLTLRFSGGLKAKGADYSGVQLVREGHARRSFLERLKAQGELLAAFSLWTLEDGAAAAETLRAREYGKQKRTHYEAYAFTIHDAALITVFTGFFAAITVLYLLSGQRYDYFRGLTDLRLNMEMLASYALMFVFLCMPFLIDAIQSAVYINYRRD